jgi:hypothetical protein
MDITAYNINFATKMQGLCYATTQIPHVKLHLTNFIVSKATIFRATSMLSSVSLITYRNKVTYVRKEYHHAEIKYGTLYCKVLVRFQPETFLRV